MRKAAASLNLFPDNPKIGYTDAVPLHLALSVPLMPTSSLSAPSPHSSLSNDPVIAALAAKRAELDARRGALSEQLAALDRELATVDGAMQLFALTVGSPPQPMATSNRMVRQALGLLRGELGHEAMGVLRSASRALTAQQIGEVLCNRRQVSLDAGAFSRLCLLIVSNLRRREARGLVRPVGRTEQYAVLWVASAPAA